MRVELFFFYVFVVYINAYSVRFLIRVRGEEYINRVGFCIGYLDLF